MKKFLRGGEIYEKVKTTGCISTAETTGTDNYSYSYDDDGRITEISLNNTVRQSYEYDSDGQLLRENNLDTNKTVIYNYDGYGNILSKVNYPYSTGDVEAALSTENYAYGDNNWKDKLTSYNGELISYDAIGNPTSYRGAVCTYYGRQLMSYSKDGTSISYSYDSDGLRTSKTVNGVKHDYYYVDGILVYEKVGDEYELFYRYDADGKLSFISRKRFSDNNVSSFSVVTNSQGDVIRILSGSGSVSAEYKYDAWGNLISVKNGSGTDVTSSAHIGLQNSIRYRGYVYDSETNLYYLQSRYYDPQTGRFINCDDVDYIGVNDTFVGWNGFAYCENDPVNNSDPSGCLCLNANWFGFALDIVFTAIGSWFKFGYDVIGAGLKYYATKKGFTLFYYKLMNSVVPQVRVLLGGNLLLMLKKAVWRVAGNISGNAISGFMTFGIQKISSFFYSARYKKDFQKSALYLVTRMLTLGSLVALILDWVSDGNPYNERIYI